MKTLDKSKFHAEQVNESGWYCIFDFDENAELLYTDYAFCKPGRTYTNMLFYGPLPDFDEDQLKKIYMELTE